ncbi:MAG: T9SS type A sorting domain-containing protein [Bacteroidota bacterium]
MTKRRSLLAFISLLTFGAIYTQTISISGQVLRHNGVPLSDVLVTCSNGDAVVSDADGWFAFSGLLSGQDYQIDGFYQASIFDEVSVLDVCYNRFIVLQVYDHLNSQWIANDYNQDGTYQGLDFIRMANASIRIEDALNELDSPWRFFDGHIDDIIINTNEVEPGINLENITADTSGLRLIAIKSGDVAIDADHQPPPADAPFPLFYIPDVALEQGEELLVSIMVRDMEQIMGFQYGLVWDTDYLEFIAFEDRDDVYTLWPNEEHVEEGQLPLMGADLNTFGAQVVGDDSTLCQVRFRALQDANSLMGMLSFNSSLLEKQAVYVDSSYAMHLLEPECIIESGGPTTVNNQLDHLIAFDVSPNPVVDELRFSIQLPKLETCIVSLLDTNGQLLQRQTFDSQMITDELRVADLPKGVYYLQVQTKGGLSSRSFIKL